MLKIERQFPKETRDISTLKEWAQNPRLARPDGLKRLRKSLDKFDLFAPLTIIEDGTVIGGNMRLRVLKEMGTTEVWVNVVKPKSFEHMVEISLKDNDAVGYYDEQATAEMMQGIGLDGLLSEITLDTSPPTILSDFIEREATQTIQQAKAPPDKDITDKKKDVYDKGDQKQIVLYVTSEERETLFQFFDQLKHQWELDSNSEVLLFMLRKWRTEHMQSATKEV